MDDEAPELENPPKTADDAGLLPNPGRESKKLKVKDSFPNPAKPPNPPDDVAALTPQPALVKPSVVATGAPNAADNAGVDARDTPKAVDCAAPEAPNPRPGLNPLVLEPAPNDLETFEDAQLPPVASPSDQVMRYYPCANRGLHNPPTTTTTKVLLVQECVLFNTHLRECVLFTHSRTSFTRMRVIQGYKHLFVWPGHHQK